MHEGVDGWIAFLFIRLSIVHPVADTAALGGVPFLIDGEVLATLYHTITSLVWVQDTLTLFILGAGQACHSRYTGFRLYGLRI